MAIELSQAGVLEDLEIELLGTDLKAINQAEDREQFKELMESLGEPIPESKIVHHVDEAIAFANEIGYPIIVRPAFTLGGTGGGLCDNEEELAEIAEHGLSLSPVHQCLIERSITGYKEIEYEVMRDSQDNALVVCNMENFDPVGIHTGDSIVFAPSQTLSDEDSQMLRDVSLKIIRALGIEGGCNVQLALDPHSANYYVIEVNPRVSRSSALASKATGYPIAKLAAKIAVGLTLDEMINPVTGSSYSMFEPALDYVVCKMPRFPFDKFEHADRHLGTQMKATGEVMAIGRNIEESLLKAYRSLEIGVIHNEISDFADLDMDTIAEKIKHPQDDRFFYLSEAVRRGVDIDLLNQWTGINPFFLDKLLVIAELEEELSQNVGDQYSLRKAKVKGFSDVKIAELWDWTPEEVRKYRLETGILPSYKMVDTCAGEFESQTPYFYSTYAEANESQVSNREKVIVLGSGPIRIGQGVEFDYATVHCVEALKHAGYEAIVINSNPETVSTDFSISDKLYFEPLSFEDVMNVIDLERPKGVIVQFGGQTAINLAWPLARAGVKLLGTQVEDIDRAEDRDLFEQLIHSLNIPQPNGKTVMNESEAVKAAKEIGYPVLVRPSYVIGGRAMEIVYSETELHKYIQSAVEVSEDHPVLIDDYLLGIECEVDVISDGEDAYVPGIMEHIERAGVHSGDSIAAYPPQNLSASVQATIIQYSQELAKSLHCVGLMNIQFIVQGEKVYVIEVNPRASRTVPFLSKVTNISMAQVATQLILGKKLGDLIDLSSPKEADGVYIKAPVFSFNKLAKVDSLLGPEMKSTGEVIGCGRSLEEALYKAFEASGLHLPQFGNILFTIDDLSKEEALTLANGFKCLGYEILTTTGTGQYFSNNGLKVKAVAKISSNEANSIPNLIENGKIQAIINTVGGQKEAGEDGQIIRQLAIEHNIPLFTTLDTALAMLKVLQSRSISTQAL